MPPAASCSLQDRADQQQLLSRGGSGAGKLHTRQQSQSCYPFSTGWHSLPAKRVENDAANSLRRSAKLQLDSQANWQPESSQGGGAGTGGESPAAVCAVSPSGKKQRRPWRL